MKLKKETRLYDLAAGEGRLYRLSYPNRLFVPVKITADEESAAFEYNLDELEPLENLRARPIIDRLRLLINIAGLESLSEEYSFSLAPDNLCVDRNLQPLILARDLLLEDNRHDFTEEYKALAGTLLASRYKFADYLEGGGGLYKKNKRLKGLPGASTVTGIRDILKAQYEKEAEINRTKKVLIDRRQRRFLRTAAPVCFVLFVLGAALAWYMNFVVLSHQSALLTANRAFLRENFDGAIDALRHIDPMSMAKEERYQLARAYVISESLSPQQRAQVLSGITLMTDDNLLLYWISLGRLKYDDAMDIAMRVGDDELLIYALLTYEVSVQIDTTRSGEEKTRLLSDLNQQIEALRKRQEEKQNAVDEDAIDDEQVIIPTQTTPGPENAGGEDDNEEAPDEDGGDSQ
jgi:type VII secretion protein EssB